MSDETRRRLLLAAGALLVASRVTAQQAPKQFRVGSLQVATKATAELTEKAFLVGMRERGYEVGKNLTVDYRYANGDRSRLPALADELIGLRPDVLVATQITAAALQARTPTIPIVLLTSADPVSTGLVKSLARPGTNVTGMSAQLYQLLEKQVDLLTSLIPGMSHIAFINEPMVTASLKVWETTMRTAAKAKGLTLTIVTARDAMGLREAFATLEQTRPQGLIMATNAVIHEMWREIVEWTTRLRFPFACGVAAYAENGALLSYGVDFEDSYRQAARYVDRILKGANPADLPVEQVSKFTLAINLKVARELGIKVPEVMLLRADRLIE